MTKQSVITAHLERVEHYAAIDAEHDVCDDAEWDLAMLVPRGRNNTSELVLYVPARAGARVGVRGEMRARDGARAFLRNRVVHQVERVGELDVVRVRLGDAREEL